MSTATIPDTAPDATAEGVDSTDGENLLFWLGGVMLFMTLLIIFAITQLSTGAGIGVCFGALLIAMAVVFAYIWRFIGPDDQH